MKTLTNLDDRLLAASGEVDPNMPTARTALLLIGNTKARTADEARRITRLVRLLLANTPQVELAEEDLKAVKDAIEANGMSLMAFIQGQLLERLDVAAKG